MSEYRPLFTDDVPAIERFDGHDTYCLSNFAEIPVEYEGVKYPTSEHAYQTAKTLDEAERAQVAACETPGQAKRAGQKVKMYDGFEADKDRIMHDIVAAKFAQNPEFADILVATYPAKLVEGNVWHDNYWGDCKCRHCADIEGANKLGLVLMTVRHEIMESRSE